MAEEGWFLTSYEAVSFFLKILSRKSINRYPSPVNLSGGFCKYPHVFTTEAQRTRRGLCFFVCRDLPANRQAGIPIDENNPCEILLAQNILVCRYLPTNKNSSLCPLCLCGEPIFVTAIVWRYHRPRAVDSFVFLCYE